MNTLKYISVIAIVYCSHAISFAQGSTNGILNETPTAAQSHMGDEELKVVKAFKAKLVSL